MPTDQIANDFADIARRMQELREEPAKATTGALWWCEDCGTEIYSREVTYTSDRTRAVIHREATGGCGCQVHPTCGTCENSGWIDQRVSGHPLTAWCECPDCRNPFNMDQP